MRVAENIPSNLIQKQAIPRSRLPIPQPPTPASLELTIYTKLVSNLLKFCHLCL